ncbi:uncharacterized protein TNCT_394981, partial [Trichonephila clavata]
MEVNKEKIRYILQFFFDKGEYSSQATEIVNGAYSPDTVTANYEKFKYPQFRPDSVETDISHISVSDSLQGENQDILEFKESVLKLEAETQCSKDIDCHYAGKCITRADGSKECECKNGTSGSLCQDVDECVANPYMCGNGTDVRCIFDVSLQKATCKCDNSRKKFDPGTETCR